MNYDCSVTNRKGCNYCLHSKTFKEINNYTDGREENLTFAYIDEHACQPIGRLHIDKQGEPKMYRDEYVFQINYCPICGRDLTKR